jgi:hypothetical protein
VPTCGARSADAVKAMAKKEIMTGMKLTARFGDCPRSTPGRNLSAVDTVDVDYR